MIEVIRIGDCLPFHVFAKNSKTCNFLLLQHNRPQPASCSTANSGNPPGRGEAQALDLLSRARPRPCGGRAAAGCGVHRELEATPRQANFVLAVCSKAFSLAEAWSMRAEGSNPCTKIERNPENARERFLSADELERLGATLRQADIIRWDLAARKDLTLAPVPRIMSGIGKRLFTQIRTLHRRAEPRFVRRINAQAGYSVAEGTNVRHLRPSQTILQSRQRMHANFLYLANPGHRRDLSADCRTLFAIGHIGNGEGIKTDRSRIESRCSVIGTSARAGGCASWWVPSTAPSIGPVPNAQLCSAGTNPIVSRLRPNTSFDVSGFGQCRLVKL